ncbi:MAG: alpha/beta hydrolase, partial [Pseudomonadota bacterium]|nr:alpha/beta hydrolase [Pseudomonadota bacterium]
MTSRAFDRRQHPPGATFSTWRAGDGWGIRRIDWPQPKGAAVRGSLLFVGGRGDFIEKYLEALAHWHDGGWNVTSFDWRGQGDSRGEIVGGHLESFDPLVEDLGALVEGWVEASPGPHALVAHSMGGHLALRLLTEGTPRVDALVLVAPMIGINAAPVPPWLGRNVARLLTLLGLRKRRAWKSNERPAPPERSRQTYLTSDPDRYADEVWWHRQQP